MTTLPYPRVTRSVLFVASLLLLTGGRLNAQTTATPADAPKKSADSDETIKLTPFTVNTDKDTGFAATSALAGGRLATDLRDTPVAYSVIDGHAALGHRSHPLRHRVD